MSGLFGKAKNLMNSGKGLGHLHHFDMRDMRHRMRDHLGDVVVLPDYMVWDHGDILDQGQEGSCVGHGWTAWQNCKPVGHSHQHDHAYAVAWYERAQELDPWPGTNYEGTSCGAGAKVALERNLLGEWVWASGVDDIDAWILGKGPVVIACDWFRSMDDDSDPGGFLKVDPSSGVRGGHCFLLFGKGPGGNYHFQNSWGVNYAQEGCFKLAPPDLQRLVQSANLQACSAAQTNPAL